MRTSRLLLILVAVVGFCWPQNSVASTPADTAALIIEDSINARSLIISEIMQNERQQESWTYAEFTNTGVEALDLTRYFTWSTWHNNIWASGSEMVSSSGRHIRLQGTLEPGESYVIVRREHNTQEDPWGELLYPNGYSNMEAERHADIIATRQGTPLTDTSVFYSNWNEWRIGLVYSNRITETADSIFPDSIFIDRFNVARDDYPSGNMDSEDAYRFPIAGVQSSDPRTARVYVRKYGVLKGNTVEPNPTPGDYPTIEWDNSRGTDIDDSEWIPLPRSMDGGYDKAFTTIGYHGPSPALTISSSTATIDDTNKEITIPYGTSRDSVFRMFEVGLNHAWELKLGADTGKFFVQEDDSIFFYTAGEKMDVYKYAVKFSGDKAALAQVSPLVYKDENEVFVRNYDISNGVLPMDTIGTLPFDLPVDTFFKYTVKEENATWKIIPKDGVDRPEIKEGDILEVTAEDGVTKKEYYMGVQQFFPNHNADLSSIYFPGLEIFEDPITFFISDTLIGFGPNIDFYTVNLPSDIVTSPSIIAAPASTRSQVIVNRAKDLKGSAEDRTASIMVIAEDDTTIKEYKIVFVQERATPDVKGDLFISDMGGNWTAHNHYNIQIFNPSDDFVNLSDYALITIPNGGMDNITNSFANDSAWANNNKYVLRPGYTVMPDPSGVPVFKTDLLQNTISLEPKEVYSMVTRGGTGMLYADDEMQDRVDLVFGGGGASDKVDWWSGGWLKYAQRTYGTVDPYGYNAMLLNGLTPKMLDWGRSYLAVARILNDSIKNGEKHVWGNFAEDYEIVDVFGGFSMPGAEVVLYDNDTITKLGNLGRAYGLTRKPHIYTGNPVDGLSWGLGETESPYTTYVPSEWYHWGFDESGNDLPADDPLSRQKMNGKIFESHVMITYEHISYLTSAVYLLGEGLEGPQEVVGVTSGTTVSQFLTNVDKADTGMVIKVYGAGDVEIFEDDAIVAGTNVWSWSANGLDSVNYVITTLGALDNACTLTSSAYTVTSTVPTGVIAGIKIGTPLEEILAKIIAPGTATVNVTDGVNQNLPIYKYNGDTILHDARIKVATLASTDTYIEVVAQDKVTKCLYSMEFEAEEDPFILSDVYVVDEAEKVINFVGRTSPDKFLANLVPSTGATLKVVNKFNQERTIGTMEYSDRAIVTKGDVSVSYWLKFTINDELIGVKTDDVQHMELSIYPNPTTDFVTLSGVNGKYIEIRDIAGKIISKQTITNSKMVIDMRRMSSGIYIISTEANSYKVIKE